MKLIAAVGRGAAARRKGMGIAMMICAASALTSPDARGYNFYRAADGGLYPPTAAVGGLMAAAGSSGRARSTALVPVVEAARRVFVEAQPGRRSPDGHPAEDTFTLPDLVTRADLIVAGEVVDLKPSWNVERSDIATTVILRADHFLKGSVSGEIRFRIPGGAVGDDWVWVTHAPRFEMGERALVFLRFGGPRLPTVVGMEAGKRHLVAADDGSERILPELRWQEGAEDTPVVLTTIGELAAALPRIEAHGRSLRRD